MDMSLEQAIRKMKIKISNRKMNKLLAESGVNFNNVKNINSVVLERKQSKYLK